MIEFRTKTGVLLLSLVLVALACTAGSCEEPREVTVSFVNGTDRHLGMLAGVDGQTFDEAVAQRTEFPATRAPGAAQLHAEIWFEELPDQGEPYCYPNRLYYFFSPKDPGVVMPPPPGEPEPTFKVTEIDLVHTLKQPCWPAQTGNSYLVEPGAG